MKTKSILKLILLSVIALSSLSCKKKVDNQVITLSIEKEQLTFSSNGGEVTLKVTTNDPKWSVSTEDQWINTTRIGDEINIKVHDHKGLSSRKGQVVVSTSSPKRTIEVIQEAVKSSILSLSLDDITPLIEKSKIIDVIDPDSKKPIAQVCLEWLVSGEKKGQLFTLYLYKDGKVDYSSGEIFEKYGKVEWNLKENSCTWNDFKSGELDSEVYFNHDKEVLLKKPEGEVKKALLQPHLLVDKRGEEVESYSLVKIGKDIWMAENLRTLKYKDGTAIAQHDKKENWQSTILGAVSYYEKKEENLKKYGALYNWYAVTDERGLAPEGFVVPSDKQWAVMIKYIFPQAYGLLSEKIQGRESEEVAQILKDKDSWNASKGHEATSMTGFNALAAGSTSKSKFMDYSGIGRQAYFWTSTGYETATAMFRRLYWDENFINRWYEEKIYGYSVRCVKK